MTNYYNDDLSYEMMNAILPDPEFENTPDVETVIEDLREILKLCHAYTYNADTAKEHTAAELGRVIVGYLFGSWTGQYGSFEETTRTYWEPTPKHAATPSDEAGTEPVPTDPEVSDFSFTS